MPDQIDVSSLRVGTNRRALMFAAWASSMALAHVWSSSSWAQGKSAASKSSHPALTAAAARCGTVGTVCLKHCIRLTKAGDKSISDCMRAVQAMLPVCSAVGRLASQDAKRLKDLLEVCVAVCNDCEAECRKHEFHHVECKNCAEACAAMVKEAKALLA